jgi:hypothetical protein
VKIQQKEREENLLKTRRRRNDELKESEAAELVEGRGEIERSNWRQSREEDLQCRKGAAEPSRMRARNKGINHNEV